METCLPEESLWANALAARLRLLQASFADDPPATRQDYLVQEIQRALQGSTPENRKRFIAALKERFPEPQASFSPIASPASGQSDTPLSLLQRLLDLLPSIPDDQRARVVVQLKSAGLIEDSAGALAIPADLAKRLGLDPAKSLDTERVGKTLAMLVDLVLTLDQFAWALWKQLAPKSIVRKEADLVKLAGDHLCGSPEVSSAQVLQALERTRKLIAGLLGAVGRAGSAHARERSKLFNPEAIKNAAAVEKKWNESLEFACWRKYVQLHAEYNTESAVEKSLQEIIVKEAEALWRGGRPAS